MYVYGLDAHGETAIITNIQRYSVHDGPGLRTVVFFKGCPLSCEWCQNPETRSTRVELMLNRRLCINCHACEIACPEHVARALTGEAILSRNGCLRCGKCCEHCYSGARELVGREVTLSEVLDEVGRDRVFYANSGGGVTVSGGEPLMQAGFVASLFNRLKCDNIDTAIETCGFVPWENIEAVLPFTDIFLFDVKAMDADVHRRFTGCDNALILENLAKLKGRKVIIRTPLIPGVNDNPDMYRSVGELARDMGVDMVHLLPFHQLGSEKWRGMDMAYAFNDVKPIDMEVVSQAEAAIREYGVDVHVYGY